jgi:hypothetical protein
LIEVETDSISIEIFRGKVRKTPKKHRIEVLGARIYDKYVIAHAAICSDKMNHVSVERNSQNI